MVEFFLHSALFAPLAALLYTAGVALWTWNLCIDHGWPRRELTRLREQLEVERAKATTGRLDASEALAVLEAAQGQPDALPEFAEQLAGRAAAIKIVERPRYDAVNDLLDTIARLLEKRAAQSGKKHRAAQCTVNECEARASYRAIDGQRKEFLMCDLHYRESMMKRHLSVWEEI